jgi:acetyltransferase-like isoleucine patch superfamily enzyme
VLLIHLYAPSPVFDNVTFDDYTVIDAKGEDNKGIKIGNNVLIGRNTTLSCNEPRTDGVR